MNGSNHVETGFLENLAEISPAAVTQLDREGRIVYANCRAEEVLSLEKSQIEDRIYEDPQWEITDFEGKDFPPQNLPSEQVKRTQEPVYDVRYAVTPPQGERKLLSVNASPLFDEDSNFRGTVSVIEDLTEDVRRKRKLEKSKRRYSKLIQNMNSGVAVYEAVDGGENFILRDLNQAAAQIDDLDRRKVIGKPLTEVLPKAKHFGLLEVMREVKETGETRHLPESYYRNERIEGWREGSVYQLTTGEIVVVYHDITKRKKAEQKSKEYVKDLDERYKELDLLYEVTNLSVRDLPVGEIFQRAVKLLPPAWQYPDITCGRIVFGGEEFTTDNFRTTQWGQSADIVANGEVVGFVEVYYLEEKPPLSDGPFLSEERELIESVARILAQMVERRGTQRKNDHLNELLHAVRNINQLLVKTGDQTQLIRGICEILNDITGYNHAWIALLDGQHEVTAFSQAGLEENSKTVETMFHQRRKEQLPPPILKALESQGVIATDEISHCGDCPLQSECQDGGTVTTRLQQEGKVYGLLSASIPKRYIDAEEETSLLEEVAGDIAFGLHAFEIEKMRTEAEEIRRRTERRFQRAIRYSPYPIMIHAEDGEVININEAWREITGYEREDISTISEWTAKAYGEAKNEVIKNIERLYDKNSRSDQGEYEISTNEGEKRVWDFSSAPIGKSADGRRLVLSMANDVTDKRRKADLLSAFNEAAIEIESALTKEEMFDSVSRRLKEMGLHSVIYILTEDHRGLVPKYLSFENSLLRGAEKMLGLNREEYAIPNDASTPHGKAIERGDTYLVENVIEGFRSILPEGYKNLASQAAKFLGLPENEIVAPIIVGEETLGIFSLLDDSLSREHKDAVTAFARLLGAGWQKTQFLMETKEEIAERKKVEKKLRQSEQKLEQSFVELAHTTSRVLGVRDPYTQQHEQRVAELARDVGQKLGLGEERLLGLYLGGLLHDIGKIAIPETILTKPGELDDIEWQMIKSHPEIGYNQILKDTNFPWPVAEMTLHHHERLDGSGYPDGLKGEELSAEIRILGAVDVVEAMSSRRPYREARSKEEVLKELRAGKDTIYDAQVAEMLIEMIEQDEIALSED